jgi:hypothetical protein
VVNLSWRCETNSYLPLHGPLGENAEENGHGDCFQDERNSMAQLPLFLRVPTPIPPLLRLPSHQQTPFTLRELLETWHEEVEVRELIRSCHVRTLIQNQTS